MNDSSRRKGLRTLIGLALVSITACATELDRGDGTAGTDGADPARGPYLGQPPPERTAELFAPGVVSTGSTEVLASFTPDGRSFFYTMLGPFGRGFILERRMSDDGAWGVPEVVPFSGKYSDFGSAISPDGRRLFFVSNRPLRDGEAVQEYQDIWIVEILQDGWGEPINPGPPVNSDGRDLSPCPVANGNLYFNSTRGGTGTENRMDIYRTRFVEGRYLEPENLGAQIPIPYDNFEPAVAADESYMVFVASGGPANHGQFDLYASFHGEDGRWSEPANLGPMVNTDANEHFPTLSPDGRYLFFVSDRTAPEFAGDRRVSYAELRRLQASPQNGSADIYWVSTSLIERIRPGR